MRAVFSSWTGLRDITASSTARRSPSAAKSRTNLFVSEISPGPTIGYLNIEKYGNMSAASSAVALVEAFEEGRIKKGDKILLDAFGGGLTWGAIVIEW